MVLRAVVGTVVGVVYVISLLYQVFCLNVAQVLCYLLECLRLTDRRLRDRVNVVAASALWGVQVMFMERWGGLSVRVTGDPLPAGESAIVLSNHASYTDYVVIFALAQREGALPHCRFFAKALIAFWPLIGWALYFFDFIFVSRSWDADRARIAAAFAAYAAPPPRRLWLVSFLEGSRLKPSKLAASRRFARERGLPELAHVLVPRTRGFAASVRGLGARADAVYDLTIGYKNGSPPSLWELAKGGGFHPVCLHVRRFAMEKLMREIGDGGGGGGDDAPRSAALERWTYQLFKEKDDLLQALKDSEGGPRWGFPGKVQPLKKVESVKVWGPVREFVLAQVAPVSAALLAVAVRWGR
jgi:lysocardiolipin and lysophospholipid acyltransferase